MADLTVQPIVQAGLNPSFVAAAGGGDAFLNDGRTYLEVINGGGGSINVTLNSQSPCNYGFDHDQVVAVPAGERRKIGPFNPARFNDTNGKVQITYSAVTSVTVGAFSE